MCLKIDNHYRAGFVETGWVDGGGTLHFNQPAGSRLPISLPTSIHRFNGQKSISKYNVPPCTCPDYRTGMYSVACYRNDVGTDVGISGPTPSEKYYGDGN